jgi:hypothetical protein
VTPIGVTIQSSPHVGADPARSAAEARCSRVDLAGSGAVAAARGEARTGGRSLERRRQALPRLLVRRRRARSRTQPPASRGCDPGQPRRPRGGARFSRGDSRRLRERAARFLAAFDATADEGPPLRAVGLGRGGNGNPALQTGNRTFGRHRVSRSLARRNGRGAGHQRATRGKASRRAHRSLVGLRTLRDRTRRDRGRQCAGRHRIAGGGHAVSQRPRRRRNDFPLDAVQGQSTGPDRGAGRARRAARAADPGKCRGAHGYSRRSP